MEELSSRNNNIVVQYDIDDILLNNYKYWNIQDLDMVHLFPFEYMNKTNRDRIKYISIINGNMHIYSMYLITNFQSIIDSVIKLKILLKDIE